MSQNASILVWAKLRYWYFWPARIGNAPPEVMKTITSRQKACVCVFFFGSKNYGFVERQNIFEYTTNRSKYVKRGRGAAFNDAVAQMDEYVLDPVAFASNGYCNPNDNQITVKNERNSVVKTESGIDEMPYELETVQCPSVEAQIGILHKEKENVIKELLSVKGENQKFKLQLQYKQREINKLNGLMSTSTQKHATDVQHLTIELNELKEQLEAERSKRFGNAKTISNLSREKKLLTAQVTQLRLGVHQNANGFVKSSIGEPSDSEEFEVESILAHKVGKKDRQFLVRWKGYSSEHDLWVKEHSLNCPLILTSYLKQKKMK